jgi:hypothetical protein
MRIISKFKDYYDGIVPHDTDSKRVYVRKTRDLDVGEVPELVKVFDRIPVARGRFSYSYADRGDYRPGVLAFCGRAYPFYWTSSLLEKNYTLFADFEEVLADVRRRLTTKGKDCQISEIEELRALLESLTWPKEAPSLDYILKPSLRAKTWERFLAEVPMDLPDEMFVRVDAPIVLLWRAGGDWQIEANPRLNEWGFQKMIDPWTAYQELDMFVGTNLVKQMDPNVHIPDEIKAESHGFNKWSFRRPPKGK